MESGNALDKGPHPLPHRLGVNAPHQSARLRLVFWVGAQEDERPQHVFKPTFVRHGAASFHHRPRVEDGVDARAERRAEATVFCPPDVHRPEGLRSSLHELLPLAVRHCDQRLVVLHRGCRAQLRRCVRWRRERRGAEEAVSSMACRWRRPKRWLKGGNEELPPAQVVRSSGAGAQRLCLCCSTLCFSSGRDFI